MGSQTHRTIIHLSGLWLLLAGCAQQDTLQRQQQQLEENLARPYALQQTPATAIQPAAFYVCETRAGSIPCQVPTDLNQPPIRNKTQTVSPTCHKHHAKAVSTLKKAQISILLPRYQAIGWSPQCLQRFHNLLTSPLTGVTVHVYACQIKNSVSCAAVVSLV